MPIYEYRCTQCSGEFEYRQRMTEDPKTVCETCGGSLERLISLSSFHLKGGGWYKDLYSSAKPADADKKKSAGESADANRTSGASGASGESSGGSKESSGSSSSASPAKGNAPATSAPPSAKAAAG